MAKFGREFLEEIYRDICADLDVAVLHMVPLAIGGCYHTE